MQKTTNDKALTLLLIPGLGVSYEIFLPLIRLTEDSFRIIAAEVDGFTLGKHTRFTSVDDQAVQIIAYVQQHYNGHLNVAYGLSYYCLFSRYRYARWYSSMSALKKIVSVYSCTSCRLVFLCIYCPLQSFSSSMRKLLE